MTTYEITCTHCLLCNRPLTDAQSIEAGIGPVCRRSGYDKCDRAADFVMAVKEAQAAGCLDMIAALLDRSDAREACNAVIRLMAASREDSLNVARLSVVRALGFETLALKIEEALYGEENTGTIVVINDGERLIVQGKKLNSERFDRFITVMRSLPRTYDAVCKAFYVPLTSKRALWSGLKAQLAGSTLSTNTGKMVIAA